MKYTKIPVAQTLVALCEAKGIHDIVISPGSRNAPLTIGFTENPTFSCYSIVDERCAAFFALGMAQQSQRPVALLCTSGSAVLNYYPAIAEAFYSDIPLVVLSADRPRYRIDIGDGQTIRQDNVFDRHILGSFNLRQDTDHASEQILSREKHKMPPFITERSLVEMQTSIQQKNEKDINAALNLAIEQQGPVHVNIPMEEPLYEVVDKPSVLPANIAHAPFQGRLVTEEIDRMAKLWNEAEKKMIVVGVHQPNAIDQAMINQLASDASLLVFTETTSNIHHEHFFPSIDKLIAPIEKHTEGEQNFKGLQPDLLLTFGGMVVSKKVKAFLRKFQPKEHWHVGPKKAYDTYFCLQKFVQASPNDFFKIFLPKIVTRRAGYRDHWSTVMQNRRIRHEKYLDDLPFTDFKAFEVILQHLPKNSNLQLSNSSTIRYMQLFDVDPTIRQYCNRGTSGIDGSISTAIGASLARDESTTLITGDLSFFYDSNALWNGHLRNDFRIIVINNGGGGIFRILPGNKDTLNFDTYFETQHQLTAKSIAEMYGFEYVSTSEGEELEKMLEDFFEPTIRPKVLEIFTPRKTNDKYLLEYFEYLKD